MVHAKMFKHAYRDKSVKTAALMPVIVNIKGQMLLSLVLFCLLRGMGMLVFQQGDSGYQKYLAAFLTIHWQARPIHRQYPELSDLAVYTDLPQGAPAW